MNTAGAQGYYREMRLDALSPETTDEFLRNLWATAGPRPPQGLLPRYKPLFLRREHPRAGRDDVLEGQQGTTAWSVHCRLPIAPTVQADPAARIDPPGSRQMAAARGIGRQQGRSYPILGP
jgi:hypothetical protein